MKFLWTYSADIAAKFELNCSAKICETKQQIDCQAYIRDSPSQNTTLILNLIKVLAMFYGIVYPASGVSELNFVTYIMFMFRYTYLNHLRSLRSSNISWMIMYLWRRHDWRTWTYVWPSKRWNSNFDWGQFFIAEPWRWVFLTPRSLTPIGVNDCPSSV